MDNGLGNSPRASTGPWTKYAKSPVLLDWAQVPAIRIALPIT
jgi:hypothetical protein